MLQPQNNTKLIKRRLVTSKSVYVITLIVMIITILAIWLFGLGQHRTIFENSLLSTSILSVAFFLFLTIGLYHGIKLKDNIGKLTDKLEPSKMPSFTNAGAGAEFVSVGEGFGAIILGILVWIAMTILIMILMWLFNAIIWTSILIFIAMLYWIFFRALRFVFKNSYKCQGKLVLSASYGLLYTLLYMS